MTIPDYNDLPAVMDVPAAAAVLGCSKRKIYDLIREGELGHLRLGRLVRVPRHSLVAFLRSGWELAAGDGDDG